MTTVDEIVFENNRLKAQLTAAEEQLAEMTDALLPDFRQQLKASQQMWPEHTHIWEYVIRMVEKALSAAPKRGRVVWEGTSEVLESQEDKEPVIYIGASSGFEVDAFALWIYGRPKELKGGQPVTVKVLEAE